MSVSTCKAQSDGMQETTCSLPLAKKIEKQWGGGEGLIIKGGRCEEKDEWRGWQMEDERVHRVENKCDFSCCQKEAMPFACWSLSGSLFQRVGAKLWSDPAPEHFFVCVPPKPEMVSLHREEEQREQGGLYGETSSCMYCGAILCTHWCLMQRFLYSKHLETSS